MTKLYLFFTCKPWSANGSKFKRIMFFFGWADISPVKVLKVLDWRVFFRRFGSGRFEGLAGLVFWSATAESIKKRHGPREKCPTDL